MKKIFTFLSILGVFLTGGIIASPVVVADGGTKSCYTYILGMRPWYYGLVDEKCQMKSPNSDEFGGSNKRIATYITKIALNILFDLSVVVGYVAIIFIVVGGYQFMMSSGDPGRAARGKKTLTSAIVGLIISLLAAVIMNTISSIITKGA